MFGPNSKVSERVTGPTSHRSIASREIVAQTRMEFQEVFDLKDYDILFIPGSGTIGLEAVFATTKNSIIVKGVGKFSDRLRNLQEKYYVPNMCAVDINVGFCQLETSLSKVHTGKNCIVDAISSFPYYKPPDDARIIITSSNKQLGCLPGLAIVCVRKDQWDYINDIGESYLNLHLYRDNIPWTYPIHLIKMLCERLESFDIEVLRQRIIRNSKIVVEAVGKENVIGSYPCPVITFKKEVIHSDIAEVYGIYGNDKYWQVFTYSEEDSSYELLYRIIEYANKRKQK